MFSRQLLSWTLAASVFQLNVDTLIAGTADVDMHVLMVDISLPCILDLLSD